MPPSRSPRASGRRWRPRAACRRSRRAVGLRPDRAPSWWSPVRRSRAREGRPTTRRRSPRPGREAGRGRPRRRCAARARPRDAVVAGFGRAARWRNDAWGEGRGEGEGLVGFGGPARLRRHRVAGAVSGLLRSHPLRGRPRPHRRLEASPSLVYGAGLLIPLGLSGPRGFKSLSLRGTRQPMRW